MVPCKRVQNCFSEFGAMAEEKKDLGDGATVVCGECKKEAAKYKCPGCDLRSCSLPCVRAHKERTSCSGKRNRTTFVPIASFDDNRLLSDYNLLEEVLRLSDSAKRFRAPYDQTRKELNGRWASLRNQAKRRKIDLLYLPQGMTRRIENCSRYCKKRKCILWRIEWIFHSADEILVDTSADENESPAKLLENRLMTSDSLRKLRKICSEPIKSMRFLLVKEMCSGEQKNYVELDPLEPLGSQLASMMIIEYPTILVVSASHDTNFTIVEDRRAIKLHTKGNALKEKLVGKGVIEVEVEGVPFKEEEIEEGEIVD